MKTLLLYFIVTLLSFIVIGCKPATKPLEKGDILRSYSEQAVKKCLQTEGVPIISDSGMIQDCKWKCDTREEQ